MVELKTPLARILSDQSEPVDWRALSSDEAVERLVSLFSFLDEDVKVSVEESTATIRADADAELDAQGQRLLDQALSDANRGRYPQAIRQLEQVLERAPANVIARRNLGMAHLEIGEIDKAEQYLIQALRLDPDDAWGLLLMGNIYLQHRNDPESASDFYQRAASSDPDDPYLLSNLGALHAQQGDIEQAREYFKQAIASESTYPNSYFNLAVLEDKEGNASAVIEILETMFDQCERGDVRSDQVYENAQDLYRKAHIDLARSEYDDLMALVRNRREELEEIGGVEIELVQDDSLSVSARTQIAWHHRQRNHVVRYKGANLAITPHLLAHELEHILMEHQARERERNRFFITNNRTMEQARSSLSSDIYKLRRSMPQEVVEDYIENLLHGFADRLFNMPLDMIIETRLYDQFPRLRSSQFASLDEAFRDGVRGLKDPETRRLTPRSVYNATMAMEAAYAMFIDHLWQGRTNYAEAYERTRHYRDGKKLFELWHDAMDSLEPGDEYELVDAVAESLRVSDWYDWQPDEPQPAEEAGGVTNEALLQEKEMASTMYCLGALQRFEDMSRAEIQEIVGEIALMGAAGIDYASSEQKYTLKSVPGEQFSGLQLVCMMYVGFKEVDPTLDVGVDLSQPYQAALQLHQA